MIIEIPSKLARIYIYVLCDCFEGPLGIVVGGEWWLDVGIRWLQELPLIFQMKVKKMHYFRLEYRVSRGTS